MAFQCLRDEMPDSELLVNSRNLRPAKLLRGQFEPFINSTSGKEHLVGTVGPGSPSSCESTFT